MKGRGEIAACADDVGGVLKSYHFLEYLFPIFEDCEKLANLVLKPQKCTLVPTAKLASLQVKTCMYEWISSMIPKWRKFSVQSYAKYLGIYMGPLAHLVHWREPVAKWGSRSRMIGTHTASASLAAIT
eukprot:12401972-Karenia_brevis.AAC.1